MEHIEFLLTPNSLKGKFKKAPDEKTKRSLAKI